MWQINSILCLKFKLLEEKKEQKTNQHPKHHNKQQTHPTNK